MAPAFYFLICLKARKYCRNWPLVEANLRDTLRSLQNSTDNGWQAIIACHDIPELHPLAADRITFVHAAFSPPELVEQFMRDKSRKKNLGGEWINAHCPNEGAYIMFLDADDLVHKDLVAFVLSDNNRHGYTVSNGYTLDISRGTLARQPKFHQRCGSCFIGFFQRTDLPVKGCKTRPYFSQLKHHKNMAEVAKEHGHRVRPLPFPAVTYLINHEESYIYTKSSEQSNQPKLQSGGLLTWFRRVPPVAATTLLSDKFAYNNQLVRLKR